MELRLIEKQHLADNVWAFRFQPSEPMPYAAGQFVRVELPHDNPDSEGTKRWFTNSAAPFQDILQITTRITDSTFKQALSKLEPGSSELVLLDKPDGDFVWRDYSKPVVFVAGGIGVTPFYSILKQRVHDGQEVDVTLIYAGRTADLPFKNELDNWAASSTLKVHYIIGEPLSAEVLARTVTDLNDSLVYVSGPEPMVEKLGDELKANGLPEDQLKQDFFPNYDATNY